MKKKTKLLMGITLTKMGGAQRVVQEIIAGLPGDLFNITLVSGERGYLTDWARAYAADTGVRIDLVELSSCRREISPRSDLRFFRDLIAVIKEVSPDVAHFHSSKMGFFGRLAARIRHVPLILYTAHGWGTMSPYHHWLKRAVYGFAERIAGRCGHGTICVSHPDLALGIRRGWIPRGRGLLIENGLPDPERLERTGRLRRELHLSEETPIIGTVARLVEAKSPLSFIDLAGLLLEAGQQFALVLVGGGPLEPRMREIIAERRMEGVVILLGERYDAPELLPEFDLFLLLSRWEGMPISVIEAMFAGLPVVANNVGGMADLVVPGRTGFLIEDLNLRAAAKAISGLLNDRDSKQRMGAAARTRAKELFSSDRMAEKYANLYLGGKVNVTRS